MKKILLTSCLCFVVAPYAVPAFAQGGNTITIIREDGTKDVIELENAPPVPEANVRQEPPRVEVVMPQVEKVVDQPEVVAPVVAEEAPVDAEEAPVDVVPIVDDVVEKPRKKPKVAVSREDLKPAPMPESESREYVQTPTRKPHRQVLPAGVPITKDRALYIALSEAPPSSDVQVYTQQNESGSVDYSVVFKMDDGGGYEVLVDGVSGVIKRSAAIENGQTLVKPGHLPLR